MARIQRTVGFTTLLAAVVLLCVAGIVTFAARPFLRNSRERARLIETQRFGWRRENVRDLKELSVAVRLSAVEQGRVDQAGEDAERVRKALIDLHEQRLAMWGERLEDAQDRRHRLEAGSGYKVYGDHPQSQDEAKLIDRDEREATGQVAIFAEALTQLKAWQPMSFERYNATHARPPDALQQASTSQATSEVPPRAQLEEPVQREKPSAYVPSGREASGLEPRPDQGDFGAQTPRSLRDATPGNLPVPSLDQIPTSITVYAAPAPIVRVDPVHPVAPVPPVNPVDTPVGNEPRKPAPIVRVSPTHPTIEEGVQTTLQRWSTAMVTNDPKAEAAEYAPHLERYFLKTNVDKSAVEADKREYLRRGNVTADFALRDVVIKSETDATAEVRLVKDVTWRRPTGAEHKLIRSRLLLQKFGDGWKITGEQDFR